MLELKYGFTEACYSLDINVNRNDSSIVLQDYTTYEVHQASGIEVQ